jgi:fructokinase
VPGPIVVAGEALIDIVSSTDDPLHLRAHPGGGPYNVARALGRLGRPVRYLGCLSSDAFGSLLRAELEGDGVSLASAVTTDRPTTLALAMIDDHGEADYAFYADGTAAPALTTTTALAALPAQITALHIGTLGLVFEPIAESLEALVTAVDDEALVFVDPNCRPHAVVDHEAYRAQMARIVARADLVKVSDEDLAFLSPSEAPLEAARAMAAGGPRAVLLTRGGDGTLVIREGSEARVPVRKATVVDSIGAGDAFCGALIAWWHAHELGRSALRTGDALLDATHFAAEVATLTVQQPGAAPPRLSDLPSELAVPALFTSR